MSDRINSFIHAERFLNCKPETKLMYLFGSMIFLLLLTNLWHDFYFAYTVLQQSDTASYRAIAMAAPCIPVDEISYHHAQRFLLPWTLGLFSKLSGLSLGLLFRITAFGLWIAIVSIFYRILQSLHLPPGWRALLLAGLIFHPYSGRYYLAVPYMATDLLFILGYSFVILGFIRNQAGAAALGLIIAASGRQTFLPVMVVLWIWQASRFCINKAVPSDIVKISAASLAATGIYWLGSRFAAATGAVNENIDHLTGLANWFCTDAYGKFSTIAEFIFRGFISEGMALVLIGVLLIAGHRKITREVWLLGLFVLSVWMQPILGGPLITGNNISRLCGLGYIGLLTMAALLVVNYKQVPPRWVAAAILFCIFLSSLHHCLSWPGQIWVQTPERFAGLTLLTTFISGFAVWYGLKRRDAGICKGRNG